MDFESQSSDTEFDTRHNMQLRKQTQSHTPMIQQHTIKTNNKGIHEISPPKVVELRL